MQRSNIAAPWRHRRIGRPITMMVVVLGLVSLLGACVPLIDPPTSGRTFGQGPIDAVWEAADAHPKCAGLTSAELAAMMMVPTYPETGGPVPSPMTLGRSDTLAVSSSNRNLFAFSQTTGPYVAAYFTAGIGMWQFDSAGGWNLTAASAIDSVTSARQAATTVAFRYCNPPSSVARDDLSLRRYSWGPWYGCSPNSTWNCEALYQQLYEAERLDTAVDDRVGRYGGMEQRTCDVVGLGVGLACGFVDPARAQGSTGWRSGTYGPANPNSFTPLPRPFYVIEANGREYRYWLPADTGFDIGITAHKPVTANARTSLTWERTAALCDRSAGRGDCPPVTPPLPAVPGGTAYSLFFRDSNTSGIADRTAQFGPSRPAQVLVCDWNGDGIETPTWFEGGRWVVSDRLDGSGAVGFGFGDGGDIPICGDWNGDGTAGPGIVRQGVWYLAERAGTPVADRVFGYGDGPDVPIVGDWNGDGRATPGIFRAGRWYLVNSTGQPTADLVVGYGDGGDLPLAGDWNADGRDEIGVVRGDRWYLAGDLTRAVATSVFLYGGPGDTPLVGRWRIGAPSTPAVAR